MSSERVSIRFFDEQGEYAGRYWHHVPRAGDEIMLNAGRKYASSMGGWERKIEPTDPRTLSYIRQERLRDVEPLYSEATIDALRAERDEANEELGKVIMACPPGSRGMPIHPHVSALRYRLEAAEARVAQLEAGLEPFAREASEWSNHPRDETLAGLFNLTLGDLRRARALLSDGGRS